MLQKNPRIHCLDTGVLVSGCDRLFHKRFVSSSVFLIEIYILAIS